MAKTRKVSIGLEMDKLILKVIKRFEEVHGVKPHYFEVSNMIAQAVNKKQLVFTGT